MYFLYLLFSHSFELEQYFSIPEGFQEVDTEQKLSKDCLKFAQEKLSKFVLDFHSECPLFLQKSWRKTSSDDDFVILQVRRNRLEYQITLHIPNLLSKPEKKYIISINSIENETERNSHWIVPSDRLPCQQFMKSLVMMFS